MMKRSRSSAYRHKLKKTDPEKYAELLAQQAERSRSYRASINEEITKPNPSKKCQEMVRRQKEQARERQRKFREINKRHHQAETLKVKIPLKIPAKQLSVFKATRSSVDAKRAYWRERKQAERKRLRENEPQKLRRIHERDRKQKQEKRKDMLLKDAERKISNACENITSNYASQNTFYNHVAKARKSLPESPTKFALVVKALVKNASPRKRRALEEQGIQLPHQDKGNQEVKRKCLDRVRQSALKFAKRVMVTKKLKPGRKLLKHVVDRAVSFYKRGDISRTLPHKRYATKKNGAAFVMQMTLRRAFQTFCKDFPQCRLSFSAFAKLRPRSVRIFSKNFHETCLCVYCANISYKLQAIKKLVNAGKCQGPRICDEYQLVDLLLCRLPESQRFHNPSCIWGECSQCRDLKKKIGEICQELLQSAGSMQCCWNHWERQSMSDSKCKRVLSVRHGTVHDLIKEFTEDVLYPTQGVTFIQHLFVARWQQRQYQKIKESLASNVVLMVMDFARNRKIFYQDEIKAAYFGQQQVTMHPVVCYYQEDGCVVRESVVFLSDDLGHDHHAVNHFLKCTEDYLLTKINIKQEIIFSDGCTSQYKGRGTFADLSLQAVPTERHYFGSEHGKGEGDGEIGLINRAIDRAVLSREVIINSAEEMYEWCQANLASDEKPSRRKFFLIRKGDIVRNRPESDVNTMQGCRRLHQVKRIRSYVLKARRLSCFCTQCLHNNEDGCINIEYAGHYATRKLRLKNQAGSVPAHHANQSLPSSKAEDQRDEPSGDKDRSAPEEMAVGNFVAVKLTSLRGRCEWYVGKVADITEAFVRITYLTKTGSFFTWPSKEDISWQTRDDILCVVSPQVIITGSRIKLFLVKNDIDRVIKKLLASNEA